MTTSLRPVLGALILAAAPATAIDLHLETGSAPFEDFSQAGLERAVDEARSSSSEPVWVAYEVAGILRRDSICCGPVGCCDVEQVEDGVRIDIADRDHEPLTVLVRFAAGQPNRIRIAGRDCSVGFGGHRVLWAGAVPTSISLDLLDGWVSAGRGVVDGAATAIAFHDDPDATRWLESAALEDIGGDRSEEAIFWLGAARRADGLESLRRILAVVTDLDRRKAVVFGLAQSPIVGARDDLVRMARTDEHSEIRSEALFWIGQTDDDSAGELIYEAALRDPNPAVARHAVFVLSQLPQEKALEHLARLLAQQERPELRKEALFWIGQTDSDEALEIVARILNE